MNSNDRFYGCESLGFPEVENYDFEQNIPVRGVEDRSFRWEEVAAPTLFMLKEATLSGSFENNTFSYSNATGVNYITTGISTVNSVDFPNWNVAGNRTLWIGQSGIYIFSGDLPGVTSSFQAHPIDGDYAIGLYSRSTGITEASRVYSALMAEGAEGPILQGGRHQVYLQAKLNYGSTGLLKAFIRGWSGPSIVAYYNPFTSAWQAGVPTGDFTVSNNVTTIKYDFICTGYPSTTPTNFDLYIANTNSGSFVTVDNAHVDAYFKQNAFLDYLVPSGYVIQVTPDIGWHNIMEMFEGTETNVNPHLKNLGPFVVELGNLTDNLDNTVTATVDYTDFIKATTSTYKKYLWRAVSLTPNGILGKGGYPQRFQYIGDEVNKSFTVDNTVQDDLSTLKTITGTKSKNMVVLVDGQENHPGLTYPTPTTWKLEINVTNTSRTITVRGKDVGGNLSYFKKILLTNKLYDQNSIAVWNVFDEHGLVADVERLPNESNYDYSNRIKDSYTNRGGANFVGIVNGATRELNLNRILDGVSLELLKDQNGNYILQNLSIDVTSYSIRISSPSFVSEERVLIDPVFNTGALRYLPVDVPLFTELEGVGKIDFKDIEIVNNDEKSKYYIKVNNDLAKGKLVSIKYAYSVEILFKNAKTIRDIILAINDIVDPSGLKILKASISQLLSGNENSLGLYVGTFVLDTSAPIAIAWSPIFLKRISDRGYRDYFVENDISTLKNTKYYSFVEEVKKGTKIFWGNIEADRARWDMADSKDLAMDSVPTLFDPPLSRIISFVTGSEKIIDPVDAWGRRYIGMAGEYLNNVGLTEAFFQPGVAHTSDLTPSLFFTTSRPEGVDNQVFNIGPARNFNNTVILFSGQR